MIFSDNIIEKGSIFLRNLNINSTNTTQDVWSTASNSYGMYSVPYEQLLGYNHLYYIRYTYKFTTTNLSPGWVLYYLLNGSFSLNAGGRIDNPTAGTEYTISGYTRPNMSMSGITLTSGTIYNGASNHISGISSLVKNVLIYDITELAEILCAAEIATTDAEVKTWCDNNLLYVPRYINYNITSLISDTLEKIHIKKGTMIGTNFVETDALDFYATSTAIRNNKYFDDAINFSVYNNSGGGTVVHTRVSAAAQGSPFAGLHANVVQITTNGTASPGAGGFYCGHTAAANRIVIERFVAKIPTGYSVYAAYNYLGENALVKFLTPLAGTGDWTEYAVLYKCGTLGSGKTFSTGGHIYISGTNNTSVTWYVAYCMSAIITENENLKNFTVLGNKENIKGGYWFSRKFDTINILPNGNCATRDNIYLPSGWSYDITDIAGNAKASITLPVNASAGVYGSFLRVYPGTKYKISMWIKCKLDMTSFLVAILPYLSNKSTQLSHGSVVYVVGTKTLLSATLNPGDTTITVKNNANWVNRSYGGLGFRSGAYTGYNDKASWNPNGSSGIISGISGSNTINLKTAYTGTAMPVNTYVVEKYDGSTYPYPIGKGNLPTDNTWKYVEGYFGAANIWDGASNSGWAGLSSATAYIKLQLNLYKNDGSVPIKYSDIRIEPVSAGNTGRFDEKIQIIGGN